MPKKGQQEQWGQQNQQPLAAEKQKKETVRGTIKVDFWGRETTLLRKQLSELTNLSLTAIKGNFLPLAMQGAGIAQWLERRTRD